MKISDSSLMQQDNLKKYYCVDSCKFLDSLLVVAIHMAPFLSINQSINYWLTNCIARVAVPFYFVAAGFFLFRKTSYDNFDKNVILNYVYKILKFYIIWTFIYFPLSMYYQILNCEKGFLWGLLLWGKNFIFVGSYQLWYLNATIVAVLLLAFMINKHIKLETILICALVLYAIGLLPQSYFGLLKPLQEIDIIWRLLHSIKSMIETTRNGLFEGFLFMGIGMLLAYKKITVKFPFAVFGFICSMLMLALEILTLENLGWIKEYDMYIFLVPTTFFLFYIVSHIELKGKRIYKHLRNVGGLVFYLHVGVAVITGKAFAVLSNLTGGSFDNSLFKYCIVVILTIVLSEIIMFISNIRCLQWLKKIYC